MTYTGAFSILVYLLLACPLMAADVFEAGAGRRDITPPSGSSHYRGTSTGAHDSLYARALVLRQGTEMAALVICDVIGISRDLSVAARGRISEQTGIPFSNITITATHTHTGPRYQMSRISDSQNSYEAHLVDQIVGAALDAAKALRPAHLHAGTTRQEGLAFNRRFLMKDGKVRFNPGLQNPDIVRPMGPVDPEIGIVFLRDAAGEPLASLTVFALHLDTVGGNDYSADYPMYLSEALRKQFGTDFVSLFGIGTAGNINHLDVSRPGPQRGHDGRTREIGESLAAAVSSALPGLPRTGSPSLKVLSKTVFAPLQDYNPQELAWAESGQPQSPYPGREFLQQRRRSKILSLKNIRENEAIPPSISGAGWTLPVEVHAIRLSSETAIVTLPGEVFVELGLAIKEKSPFRNTLVIELANASIAYVPTRAAFAEGDYEAVNSRLQPGGGELLVDAALQLLQTLR